MGDQDRSLATGDIIVTHIERATDGTLRAAGAGWNRINHFGIQGSTEELGVGDRVLAEVTAASKYVARLRVLTWGSSTIAADIQYGSQIATPHDDRFRLALRLDEPSLVTSRVEVSIDRLGDPPSASIESYETEPPAVGQRIRLDASRGRPPQKFEEPHGSYWVQIDEEIQITGKVEVELTTIGCPSGAKVISYCGNRPAIGERVPAEVNCTREGTLIEMSERGYDVRIDEPIVAAGTVDIKIIQHGLPMEGRIVSYRGNLPEIGHRFRADLPYSDGPHEVQSPDGRFVVQVEEPVLRDGGVDIEVTERALPMRGQICNYVKELPGTGKMLSATVTDNARIAHPVNGGFEITLEERASHSGQALVKITEVSSAIIGQITEYERTSQNRDTIQFPRKYSSTNNSRISRRKM